MDYWVRTQTPPDVTIRIMEKVSAKPAASVMVVRESDQDLEVLLLKRNQKITFHGGAWVFPGGRVDDADSGDFTIDSEEAGRLAGVREVKEEAGLTLIPSALVPFSHWTTPVDLPKRFATWFFFAPTASRNEVIIDNSEIVDFMWIRPEEALKSHRKGALELPAPAYVTLLKFSSCASVTQLEHKIKSSDVQYFAPRLVKLAKGRCTLYAEDAGYETMDINADGPHHRLTMIGTDFDYVNDYARSE